MKKGEELFRVDPQDYQLAVEQLKRQLRQAEIDLEDAVLEITKATDLLEACERGFETATAEYSRLKKLRETMSLLFLMWNELSEQNDSSNTVVQYSAQLSSARQREYKSESSKELMEISLQKANLDLARTTVKAPVDGVIIRELVEEDSFAQLRLIW